MSKGKRETNTVGITLDSWSKIMTQLEHEMGQKYAKMDELTALQNWEEVRLYRGRAEGVARALQLMRFMFEYTK